MSAKDILHQLSEDARRLRVARKLPPPEEGKLSWEWIQRVQADFREYLEKSGASFTAIARSMGAGFSTSVLNQFANMDRKDIYIGDIDRVVRGVNNYLEIAARKAEAPKIKGWIETAVAKRMLVLIGKTIELRCMGIIFSDAGRGKTMTLQAAAGVYPGSILVRVVSGAKSPTAFARLLAHELKIKGRLSTLDMQFKIIDILKGTDRPLLIDEAHQLSTGALEFIRDIHDTCEIPIVLSGTKNINEKCNDTEAFFGQFASRVGYRYDVIEALDERGADPTPLHSVKEIRAMFESDKVRLTDDAALMLAKLGNLQGCGGLRLCKQVVFAAAGVANAKGQPIDAKLILGVLRSMHGKGHAINVLQRRVESSKLRVA